MRFWFIQVGYVGNTRARPTQNVKMVTHNTPSFSSVLMRRPARLAMMNKQLEHLLETKQNNDSDSDLCDWCEIWKPGLSCCWYECWECFYGYDCWGGNIGIFLYSLFTLYFVLIKMLPPTEDPPPVSHIETRLRLLWTSLSITTTPALTGDYWPGAARLGTHHPTLGPASPHPRFEPLMGCPALEYTPHSGPHYTIQYMNWEL